MKRSIDHLQLFDFDVGCLTKNPFRNFPMKADLPQCVEDCGLLKQIQSVLAVGVASTRSQMYYNATCLPGQFNRY